MIFLLSSCHLKVLIAFVYLLILARGPLEAHFMLSIFKTGEKIFETDLKLATNVKAKTIKKKTVIKETVKKV